MKKILMFLFLAALVLSCETTGPDEVHDRPVDERARKFLQAWEEAVRSGGESFDALYSRDVHLAFFNRDGRPEEFAGLDAVREFRIGFFRQLGPPAEYKLPRFREYLEHPEENAAEFILIYEKRKVEEKLSFREEMGELRIFHHEVRLMTPGPWAVNSYQHLADFDRDGFLNPEEMDELTGWTLRLTSGVHPVETPADEFFDRNGDGVIDEEESWEAGDFLFYSAIDKMWTYHEGWAMEVLDLDGDGRISNREVDEIVEMIVDPDRRAEAERDERFFHRLHSLLSFPLIEAEFLPVPREVSNMLDIWADFEGEGMIGDEQQDRLMEALYMDHPVETLLDRHLDENRNNWVEFHEIFLAQQASILGMERMEELVDPPYTVLTAADAYLDLQNDGRVDREDVETVVALYSLQFPEISGELMELLDLNRDGVLDKRDIEKSREFFLHPHPVNPDRPLDLELDVNRDRFVDPEELGITAGVTAEGPAVPFEERIERARWSEPAERDTAVAGGSAETAVSAGEASAAESEYYKKLGMIQDKELAVVGLRTDTKKIDDESATGLIVFVENAFVNVGKVRVVDRQNIQKIIDEYEFQATGLTDENTAVEIGKLSGADIIVIGSINNVGDRFYLNIKLIEVETAEIIGSSIADAENASGFLKMCNQAVYSLF